MIKKKLKSVMYLPHAVLGEYIKDNVAGIVWDGMTTPKAWRSLTSCDLVFHTLYMEIGTGAKQNAKDKAH